MQICRRDTNRRTVHIPVNVTADSGIVTGDSGERDRWSVSRSFILCRLVLSADFLSWYWVIFQFIPRLQSQTVPDSALRSRVFGDGFLAFMSLKNFKYSGIVPRIDKPS